MKNFIIYHENDSVSFVIQKVDSISIVLVIYMYQIITLYESEECNYDLDKIILETLSDGIDYVYK